MLLLMAFFRNRPADLGIRPFGAPDSEAHTREAERDPALERLREAGVRITNPDREPFRAAARSVYEEWADRVGGMARIEAILGLGESEPVR